MLTWKTRAAIMFAAAAAAAAAALDALVFMDVIPLASIHPFCLSVCYMRWVHSAQSITLYCTQEHQTL